MRREELGDLIAFLGVADARSFTGAAAQLGTSQSALSHAVRRLEDRLGVRLLTRTTRNVAPTAAGEQLAATLRPAFSSIQSELDTVASMGGRPAGTLRVTSSLDIAETLLLPAAARIMAEHPGIEIEIAIDQRLVDIVAGRFDAGVRLGEEVEKDMIAIPISPDIRMAVAATPDYFRQHGQPATPHELTRHACINLRLPTRGGLYAWEFEQDGRALNVRVSGQFTCNDPRVVLAAARAGLGLTCLPEDYLREDIEAGRLVRVLEDWCPPFPGYHLYYPSRRQMPPALRLFVEALRYRKP